MEPVSLTLGALAAALIAKAQERAVGRAVEGGEGAVRRLAAWLRAHFSEAGDQQANATLELVERVPDSRSGIDALARVLDDRTTEDADFGARLAALVDEVRRDPVAGSFVTEVYGDARVGKIVNITQAGDVSL